MDVAKAVQAGVEGNLEDWNALLQNATRRGQENLLRLQNPEGWWCGELMVDSTLCADYILFMQLGSAGRSGPAG